MPVLVLKDLAAEVTEQDEELLNIVRKKEFGIIPS